MDADCGQVNWTESVVLSCPLDRYCLGEVKCELRSRLRLLFLGHEHELDGAAKLLVWKGIHVLGGQNLI